MNTMDASTLILSLICSLVAISAGNKTPECPDKWMYLDGPDRCFKYTDGIGTFQELLKECKSNSLTEEGFDISLATLRDNKTNSLVCAFDTSEAYLIGLNRLRENSNRWHWVGSDRKAEKYLNFKNNSNTNTDECVVLKRKDDCQWSRTGCNTKQRGVCEIVNLNPCQNNNGNCGQRLCQYDGPLKSSCTCPRGWKKVDKDNTCAPDSAAATANVAEKEEGYAVSNFLGIFGCIALVCLVVGAAVFLKKRKNRSSGANTSNPDVAVATTETGTENNENPEADLNSEAQGDEKLKVSSGHGLGETSP